jgi:uncharacterized membrane protein
MVLAALEDTTYHLLLLLHIVSVIVAFAPASTHPLLEARFRREEGAAGAQRLYGHAVKNTRAVYFPALIAAGLFGGALIGASKTNGEVVWKFEQTWVWLGIVVWVGLCGVVAGLIWPAEKKLAAGDESAASRLSAGGGLATILVLVQLYLMIFKPGA